MTAGSTDWWSAADRQAFETRTRSLIEQYNALAPKQTPDQHVNGALTIGENIGDLGGLGIAWKAYLVSLHGEAAPVIDGLTGAQRFFLSWARIWQQKARDKEAHPAARRSTRTPRRVPLQPDRAEPRRVLRGF